MHFTHLEAVVLTGIALSFAAAIIARRVMRNSRAGGLVSGLVFGGALYVTWLVVGKLFPAQQQVAQLTHHPQLVLVLLVLAVVVWWVQ